MPLAGVHKAAKIQALDATLFNTNSWEYLFSVVTHRRNKCHTHLKYIIKQKILEKNNAYNVVGTHTSRATLYVLADDVSIHVTIVLPRLGRYTFHQCVLLAGTSQVVLPL